MFRKSSFCWPLPGCVEVDTDNPKTIAIRDSKTPKTVISFTHEEWKVFVKGVKNGEFDID